MGGKFVHWKFKGCVIGHWPPKVLMKRASGFQNLYLFENITFEIGESSGLKQRTRTEVPRMTSGKQGMRAAFYVRAKSGKEKTERLRKRELVSLDSEGALIQATG